MKYDAAYLRACVAAYLRYRRRCPIIAFERGLGTVSDYPDVLAVTANRQLVEVEIKISWADYRADGGKRKWAWGFADWRQFYYCVPVELVEKVLPELRIGAGLMTLVEMTQYGLHDITVIKPAKINGDARRLSTRDIVKMVWNQSGTLCSLARDVAQKGHR